MIRRLTLTICALLGTAALSSCATFTQNDVAATANDLELERDDFDAILASDLGASLLQFPAGGDSVTGDVARGLLAVWVRLNVWTDAFDVPADITALVEERATTQFGEQWAAAPPALRALVIADGQIGAMLQDGTVTDEQLRISLDAADVTIDPRYGTWDREQSRVTTLG